MNLNLELEKSDQLSIYLSINTTRGGAHITNFDNHFPIAEVVVVTQTRTSAAQITQTIFK